MNFYDYFDHPYWDTRKSRRPGKQYVNPYMPDLSVVTSHGSEYGGQSMTQPPQHYQEMSTATEGETISHSNSTTSDNTYVEGAFSNLAAREMVRQKIQEQVRVAREAPGLGNTQSPHLHYGRLQQDAGQTSDFAHQYPANLHQQQPLQHDPGNFYHSPYTSNAFQQQQQQQSVEHDPGNFMNQFGQQMSPPQQHPVATAGGFAPHVYYEPDHRGSPVPHHPQSTKSFYVAAPTFDSPKSPNFNPSPYPKYPFLNYKREKNREHDSPERSPQQHCAHPSPTPAATPTTTPGLLSSQIRRKQTFANLHSLESTKNTLLTRHRDLNYERRTIENRIADIKTRTMEDRNFEGDDQLLATLEGSLGRVEKEIEEVSNAWDSVGLEVEEKMAALVVGDWS